MLIPLSDDAKNKVDAVTVTGALLGFLQAVPWPEIAAMLACIYTGLRIIEWLWDRRPWKHD